VDLQPRPADGELHDQVLDAQQRLVGAILTAFFVVLFSALIDIVYALLDPRVRLS
jgi:ABC-type dipeptide/oligopeptide/nickel transport system permease component